MLILTFSHVFFLHGFFHSSTFVAMFGNHDIMPSQVTKHMQHVPQRQGIAPVTYREQNVCVPVPTPPPSRGLQGGGRGGYMADNVLPPMNINPQDLVNGQQNYYGGAMAVHGVEVSYYFLDDTLRYC